MQTLSQTKNKIETLTTAKAKEWRDWGKQAYKSTTRLMRSNHHHPDYDTYEKCEKIHNRYGESYMLEDKRMDVLRVKWGYSDDAITQAIILFKEGYNASRKWYSREDEKQQAIIDGYKSIFDEASKIAYAVDVSDIKDSFPCGSAHLYLQQYAEAEDLYKALGHFNDSSTDVFKRKLPIDMPVYGQCISFDERICAEVNEFLRNKGVFASVYSWID